MDDPPDIISIRFPMAPRLVMLIKVLSAIALVGAVGYFIAGFSAAGSDNSTDSAAWFALAAGSLVSGALLACAGYILDVLLEIYAESWLGRVYAGPDDGDEES